MIEYLNQRIKKHSAEVTLCQLALDNGKMDALSQRVWQNHLISAQTCKLECLIIKSRLTGTGF